MKYINKSKRIRFRLIVGGEECFSVEDVKSNFDFNDLYKNFKDGKLTKWLSQIGEDDLHEEIEGISENDVLTQKICLYNLFAPQKLSSDSSNIGTVKELADKGLVTLDDIVGTTYKKSNEILEAVLKNTDIDTLNKLCENDDELLRDVFFMKSYNDFNEHNCKTLINKKIVIDPDLVSKIMKEKLPLKEEEPKEEET